MTRMRQGWRVVLLVLAYPALIYLSAVVELISGTAAIVAALAVTAAYGAVVYRWWTLLLPGAGAAVWLGVLRVNDWITGECSVCGSDEDWSNAWMYMVILVVAPLTLAMLSGLVAGWLARLRRPRAPRTA